MRRRRVALVVAAVLLAFAASADARGFHGGYHGGYRGGWHGRGSFGHRHSSVVVHGAFFYDPFWYPYWGPYAYTYPYPYYAYPGYPAAPPDDDASQADDDQRRAEARPDDAARASYGLVRIEGVPDGASVDLDGRFWLTANDLDERWLALPEGEHTIAVRARGRDVVERRVDVTAGKAATVRFPPPPRD
ncbi:MAG TPA: hypothetical protein VKA21_14850 [Candidatus Binatia bacterium]|nr:hypothetical protein [Candidatus Binatia bacterium]